MATKVRIEFNSAGFREVLLSDGVKGIVQQKAEEIQARANSNLMEEETDGYKTTVMYGNFGGGRWIAHVQAEDYAAAMAEAEYKALTKAVK